MIITTHNLLLLPVLMVHWALNAVLGLAALYFFLGRVAPNSRCSRALAEFLEPAQQWLSHRLAAWWDRQVPPWVSWTVAVLGLLIIQQLLMHVMVLFAEQ